MNIIDDKKMHNLLSLTSVRFFKPKSLDTLRALLIEIELQIKYMIAAKGLDMKNVQQILKYFRPTD